MTLDDSQKKLVSGWIEDGMKLAEIQKKLEEDLGLKMTYMEVRFLMDDLSLQPKDEEIEENPDVMDGDTASAPAPGAEPGNPMPPGQDPGSPPFEPPGQVPGEAPGPNGNVSVTVDRVTRPGSIVSGKVTFSDGKGAGWYVDQMGRLGITPDEEGYKPPESDLMAFQTELQGELAKLGY